MQVTKGGFVGQTITLAKLNDSSGGKKSKRRSKEERKGMVETFVKRYQASNKGSFPSLNLTHKEVGGSYYIVREVFRELIQENRVLAPPKFSPEEQNMENLDSFLENYPLGSISFDPNVHGLPPKDNQTLLNEYEFRREKVLNSKRISELQRLSLENNNDSVNGSSTRTSVENEEFDDLRYRELLKVKGEVIDAETSEILRTEDVEVEEIAHTISEEQMHMELEMKRNEGLEVESKVSCVKPEDVVVETFPLRPVSTTIDEIVIEKQLFDGGEDNVNNITDAKVKTNSPAEDKASNTPNVTSQNLDSKTSSASLRPSAFSETTANKNQTNLELRKTAESKRSYSYNEETNPIVSFIKTCVAAFVEFWSR